MARCLSTGFRFATLVPNEWYFTTVKAVNGAGLEEADTSDGQQYLPITVGIEEFLKQSIYPNPTTGIVNLPQINDLKWQLFDATGRLVARGSNEKQINLRAFGLSKQVYTLRLITNNFHTSFKIVHLEN